jgi:hypothetical protein
MRILALNIGPTTAWAVYNGTNATKIVGGRVVYKKDPEETLEAPAKRLKNVLDNAFYNHSGINKVIFQHSLQDNDEIFKCYNKVLQCFCNINKIPYKKVKLHEVIQSIGLTSYNKTKVIESIKAKEHVVVDDIDAIAIAMLYYITETKEEYKAVA